MIALRGLQDCWLRKSELTYWDLGAYNDKASTWMSYGEFGEWYAMIILCLCYMSKSWTQGLATFGAIVILHLLCGLEDFFCYFWEPIIQLPRRDVRYPVKFWIWRFPKDLHWLGAGLPELGMSGWHNPLLMLVAGKEVRLKPFLWCVLISTMVIFVISLLWK